MTRVEISSVGELNIGERNIRDDALIAEAKALAEGLGTSVIGALRDAVRARRLPREREGARPARIAAIMEIAERTAARVPEDRRHSDHADLTGGRGVPK
jgi:hypothetical protein